MVKSTSEYSKIKVTLKLHVYYCPSVSQHNTQCVYLLLYEFLQWVIRTAHLIFVQLTIVPSHRVCLPITHQLWVVNFCQNTTKRNPMLSTKPANVRVICPTLTNRLNHGWRHSCIKMCTYASNSSSLLVQFASSMYQII